ncbi:MAG: chorismate--pyruvate lyase [Gammaproteobacteria bacterium]|nr:MAG: chorismate--pyruvate lyase [Gammaproteobacteria bacterium]
MTFIQTFFPVTLATQWQTQPQENLTNTLTDWLFDPSSLTARLKSHCQSFRVEVVGQQLQTCQVDEANSAIKTGEQVLVREVVLYCDEQPQVFARSLLPLKSLTGEEQQLAHLGTQPLGQVLFNNPQLERQSIEVESFDHNSAVSKFSATLGLTPEHNLWGRRSLFVLNKKPIMVAEVFLPNAFAYQDGITA